MIEYLNVHFALETLRNEAQGQGRDGPRVLVLGPSNAGKTSLLKLLTAYAVRLGRQPILVNLDPEEGVLSIPGTLTATAFKTLLDVEEGWGSSPMSGPSAIPVKLPLVYNYGLSDPAANDASALHYKAILSKLALAVSGRLAEDSSAKESGILIDTPGTLANTTKTLATNIIQHIVSEFAISHILVLGSERLYSDLLRRFENKPTSSSTATHASETITVAKLSKSGGCVDRDPAFMRAHRAAQIRAYFFGTPHLTNGIALSPRQQQIDFSQLATYRLLLGDNNGTNTVPADLFRPGGQDDEDEDLYNPSTTTTTNHLTTFNTKSLPTTTGMSNTSILTRLTSPTPALQSHTLSIMNAEPDAPEEDIQTSSVLGFLYVAEVDEPRGKISLLSPVAGRIPRRAIVWSQAWPEEVVGIV
jgi:polyribonucleotide 5'-hydroxyl-kinase